MCPEIVNRQSCSGQRADIWATGVMMYTLLAGEMPFVGKDEKQLFSRIAAGKYLVPVGYDGERVSIECRDLLSQMLGSGISAENALLHPWLN